MSRLISFCSHVCRLVVIVQHRHSVTNSSHFVQKNIPCRECVSTGSEGAWTRRSLGHHILHPLILRLLLLCTLADFEAQSSLLYNRLPPQIQIPNACPGHNYSPIRNWKILFWDRVSKAIYGLLNSPQKNYYNTLGLTVFVRFFENWGTHKLLFRFTDHSTRPSFRPKPTTSPLKSF